MLRITVVNVSSKGTCLRLEGRLIGPWVAELRQVAEASTKPVCLDLSELQYADTDGITLLREFLATRVIAENVSPFLQALLGSDTATTTCREKPVSESANSSSSKPLS